MFDNCEELSDVYSKNNTKELFMKEEEFETLKVLLNIYFKKEFEMYRKSYDLVYNGRNLESDEPHNLFEDVLLKDHPFQNFLNRMEQDIMDHIRLVFILENEPHRFTK